MMMMIMMICRNFVLTTYVRKFCGNFHIKSMFRCYFRALINFQRLKIDLLMHKCYFLTYIGKSCNVCSKLSLCLTTVRKCRGCGSIAVRILNFGTRWQWMVRFRPWSLYSQAESVRLFSDRRLPESCWPSGRYKKKSLRLRGVKPRFPVDSHCINKLSCST